MANEVCISGTHLTLGSAICPLCPILPCAPGDVTFITTQNNNFVRINGILVIVEDDTNFNHCANTTALTSQNYVRINGKPVIRNGDTPTHPFHPITVPFNASPQSFVRVH